jgi:hypothetical protein
MIGLLDPAEREQLILEIADYTEGKPGNLSSFLPREHVVRIELDSIPLEYAFKVVRYCEMTAWVEKPPLIIKLLNRFKREPVFKQAITRLKAMAPVQFHINGRVWDTFLLALDLPFLDRLITREAIERFSFPLNPTLYKPGVRVLVVKGPEKSGKTYTIDYIRYVNSVFAQLNFNTISIDYKKQITGRFGPKQLITSLLDQVNQDWAKSVVLPELDAQQTPRWTQQLLDVLLKQIQERNELQYNNSKMMIILDGFDDPTVPRDTLDLIQQIAAAAVGQSLVAENNDTIRLVLLGFSETVTDYRSRVKVENIVPITEDDLKAYFLAYAAFYDRLPPEEGLKLLVDKVGLKDIPDTPDKTRVIAKRVLTIAHTVFESHSIAPGEAEPKS